MSRTKLLIVDSDHATDGVNPNNFTVNISNEYLNNVTKVALIGLRTINSMYNININNNVIDYIYNTNPNSITVPVGQYNINDYITAVNGLQAHFVLSINALTLKLEWNGVSVLPLTITRNESSYEVIGVSGDLVDMVGGATLTSQLLPDLSGLSIIYVSSNALGHSHSILSNSVNSNIISAVGVNASFGFPIYYQSDTRDESDNHKYLTHQNINTIDIKLLNHQYKECVLQSQVHLIFKVYY